MKTNLLSSMSYTLRFLTSIIKSAFVIPEAFSAFFRGVTLDDFCGYVDSLTGLLNKKALARDLKSRTGLVGVLFLDIDCFKAVNDTFGHFVGDSYLIKIASTLRDAVVDHGRCYRIGGDEMIVLANEGRDIDDLETAVRAYFNSYLKVPISIGSSVGDPQSVIQMADSKMYVQKRKKNTHNSPDDIRGVVYFSSPVDRRSMIRSDRRNDDLSFSLN